MVNPKVKRIDFTDSLENRFHRAVVCEAFQVELISHRWNTAGI